MILSPSRNLWTPWGRTRAPASPRPRVRRLGRALSLLPALFSLQANGTTGALIADGSGNLYEGGVCFQARSCSDNSLSGLWLKRSSIPSFPFYALRSADNRCYSFGCADCGSGGSDFGAFTAMSGCNDPACGGSAPCGCAWPVGLSNTYTVSGFGSLAGCPTCDSDAIDPQWNGGLYHTGSACVWWAIDASFDSFQINGVLLDIAYSQVVLNAALCRWELYIACTSSLHPTKTMWWGTKTTGSTPAGTYMFQGSDCGNSTATMTVT